MDEPWDAQGAGAPLGRRDSFGRDDRRRPKRDRSPDDYYSSKRGRRSPSPRGGRRYDAQDSYVPSYERDARPSGGSSSGRYERDRSDRFDRSGSDSRFTDPMKLEYMASFAQFAEYTRDVYSRKYGRSSTAPPLETDELEQRYDAYKETFSRRQHEKFFNAHREEEWFREKYHPKESVEFKATILARRAEQLAKFTADLSAGKFDSLSFDEPAETAAADAAAGAGAAGASDDPATSKDKPDDDNGDVGAVSATGERKAAAAAEDKPDDKPDEKPYALFIKGVALTTKRQLLVDACKDIPGFKAIVLTDPRPDKKMTRLGWIVFDETADVEAAAKELENKRIDEQTTLHLSFHQTSTYRPRTVPPEMSKPSRLLHDLDQAKRLSIVLDAECAFTSPDASAAAVEAHLDNLLGPFEPYTKSTENDDVDAQRDVDMDGSFDAANGNGVQARRASSGEGALNLEHVKRRLDVYLEYLRVVHNYDYYTGVECVSPEDHSRRSGTYLRRPFSLFRESKDTVSRRESFAARLDSRVELRMTKPTSGSLLTKLGGRSVDDEVEKVVGSLVSKEAEGKFRCTTCAKLFKGDEYARKHVRTKHPEALEKPTADLLYFNNYVLDCNKIDTTRPPSGSTGSGIGGGGGPGPADRRDTQHSTQYNTGHSSSSSSSYARNDDYGRRPASGPSGPSSSGEYYGPRDEFGRRIAVDQYRDDGRGDSRRRSGGGLPPPMPPGGRSFPRRSDPRQLRSYHDLDAAPAGGDLELNYD
ncbi:hypothetical protein BC831DRAFT_416339 [Entophlyctis helioformis]|nr:hypothetical protein BC831DRAFT_416339 [Entophlyctis helioformis]